LDLHGFFFFGCRHEATEYLYREEIQTFLKSGVLTRLSTAFSRDTDEITYVQHRILEHGDEICDWMIDKNGFFYVCGDAKGMAKGVLDALLEIIKKFNKCDNKAATEIRSTWMKEKRLLLDVWA